MAMTTYGNAAVAITATHQPGSLTDKRYTSRLKLLGSVSAKLKMMMALTVLVMLLLGYQGLTGMHQAEAVIEDLYQ